MLEKFLNKNEKKLFSIKTLKKIKRQDFRSYLDMEETILESMKQQYELEKKYNNRVLENRIANQQHFVDTLNKYYNEVLLKRREVIKDETDYITEEFENMLKEFIKIQK
ncbi:hypothetical protein [Spiroplasma monobiae]|uniref:Flagellar FliJ protein n=1 Tax=Spiroplasma monobiae MQ-1 TaxID=1336748 RepID=A0A2K9LUL5_SPISQ|nr:hypothetical protein [Spiroplasma monobiae]AUM62739.1 hypothetical protein SMONO_v1c04900 [Spiroplasma monobiae MQ-1]